MKQKMIILAITGLMGGMLFTGCGSSENKVENASENVVDAQKDLDKAEQEFAEEWDKFINETDERIVYNENEIVRYREDKGFNKQHKAHIDELEAKNSALRTKRENYKAEKRRENWAEFKREFNHDMDELGNAFKDLGKNNKN